MVEYQVKDEICVHLFICEIRNVETVLKVTNKKNLSENDTGNRVNQPVNDRIVEFMDL